MKNMKRIFAPVLIAFLLICQALPAFAISELVIDEAGVLSADEVSQLQTEAQELYSEYGLPIYAVTVASLDGTDDAYDYATAYYTDNALGAGDETSGIMLLLAPQEREYALIAHGEGNNVLTDYGNEKMAESFVDYFADDDWYGGFSDYLATAESYCQSYYDEGVAFDSNGESESLPGGILNLGIVLISLAFGGFGVAAMVGQMKTARKQTNANLYVEHGEGKNGLKLSAQSDDYLYTQTIVTRRPKPQSKSGGGGGTTIRSGGFSGSSGKF